MEVIIIIINFVWLHYIVLVLSYINMNPPRVYTCSQSYNPPPTSLPVPSLWVIPVLQPQASCILYQTWTGDSFLIWYYTCFNASLPNHPTLSLSHRVQNTVWYICVSFAVFHTGLSLPSWMEVFTLWFTSHCFSHPQPLATTILPQSFANLSLIIPVPSSHHCIGFPTAIEWNLKGCT